SCDLPSFPTRRSSDLTNDTLLSFFSNSNNSSGSSLDFLDNLTTGTNYGTDHFFRNPDFYNSGSMRLVVGTRFVDNLGNLAKDVHTTFTGLVKSLFKYFVRKTVNLDIHLGCGNTFFSTGYLEVHITK